MTHGVGAATLAFQWRSRSMEWVIIALVPVLIIAWRYLWASSKPPQRHVMTDVRGALADRLQELALDARDEEHNREAQRLEYQAKWLRTRPTDIGGDEPPENLLASEERHVRFAGAVWEDFGTFLAGQNSSDEHESARLESTLRYTKEGIASAVQLLLEIGEGRTPCSYIDTRSIPDEALVAMREALQQLDEFVDQDQNPQP
jgi:hypothetical protein